MTAVDFGRFTDRGPNGQVSSYQLINGYVEKQGEGAKGLSPVFGVPGSVRWDEALYDGIIRGACRVRGKGLYTVLGGALVRFTTPTIHATVGPVGGITAIGAAGGLGYVTMAANMVTSPEVGIVTEDGLYYICDTATDTVTEYTAGDLPAPVSIDMLDRYFIFAIADGRIFHTELDDAGNIDPLSFAYAESSPDGLKGVFGHRGALVALGEETMEVWENVGTQPFAFSSLRADIGIGCASLASVTKTNDGLAWVDHDNDVRLLTTSEPQSIGTNDLARRIYDLSDNQRAGLRGDYYSFAKKRFYALSSSAWTYEYDLDAGVWHERKSRGRENWRHQVITRFGSTYVAGNRDDGKLYKIDANAYTEAGEQLVVRARSQTVHQFPRGGKCNKLTVDLVTGEGSVGEDDVMELAYSKDGGANWIIHGTEPIGRLGDRNRRVQFRQLGKFDEKGIIFELACSAPIMRSIINVDAQITPLAK